MKSRNWTGFLLFSALIAAVGFGDGNVVVFWIGFGMVGLAMLLIAGSFIRFMLGD